MLQNTHVAQLGKYLVFVNRSDSRARSAKALSSPRSRGEGARRADEGRHPHRRNHTDAAVPTDRRRAVGRVDPGHSVRGRPDMNSQSQTATSGLGLRPLPDLRLRRRDNGGRTRRRDPWSCGGARLAIWPEGPQRVVSKKARSCPERHGFDDACLGGRRRSARTSIRTCHGEVWRGEEGHAAALTRSSFFPRHPRSRSGWRRDRAAR